MFGVWAPLFWSVLFLSAIWWLSRRQAFYLMSALYHLTRSQQVAIAGYVIFFWPGTLVHEFAHWIMAKILGVKTAGFHIIPDLKTKNGTIQLGSVNVRGGGLVEHTLIGMAPMLLGGALTLALSYWLVDVDALVAAIRSEQSGSVLTVALQTFQRPDALIWLYLLFTISGSMFLSASDRAPVQRLALYLAAVLLPLYLFGLIPALPPEWTRVIAEMFTVFASGLAVAVALHLVMTVVFVLIYGLARVLRPGG
jgi:hypothetical protein